jgi:hypothetical protein
MFHSFNWSKIAQAMGGTGQWINNGNDSVAFYTSEFGMVEIHDNGGEINVTFEKPNPDFWVGLREVNLALHSLQDRLLPDRWRIFESIPYSESVPRIVGPHIRQEVSVRIDDYTLAYRITAALRNERIDWKFKIEVPE